MNGDRAAMVQIIFHHSDWCEPLDGAERAADALIAAGWVNSNRLIEMARAEGSADECEHNFETICTGCGIEVHDWADGER